MNISVEKAIYLYEKYGLAIARDGDRNVFIVEIDNKKDVCGNKRLS